MEFLDLNDDCLDSVFDFCDIESIFALSETSKRLNVLVQKQYPKQKKYICNISSAEDGEKAKKILEIFGENLITLSLNINFYGGCEFFELLTKFIGENLRKLEISGEICVLPFLILAPVLNRLEVLNIFDRCNRANCLYYIDLPCLCRNLKSLFINSRATRFAPNRLKTFKKLENLELCLTFGRYYENHPFKLIIEQNQQLKKLQLWARHDQDQRRYVELSDLARYLTNLEEINIDVNLIRNMSAERITDLNPLCALHSLTLFEITNVEHLHGLLTNVTSLKQLRVLFFHADIDKSELTSDVQQSLIGISKELHQLQKFRSVGLSWEYPTVLQFIQNAKNLDEIDIHSDLPFKVTPQFIKDIAAARKKVSPTINQPLRIQLLLNKSDDTSIFKVQKKEYKARFS